MIRKYFAIAMALLCVQGCTKAAFIGDSITYLAAGSLPANEISYGVPGATTEQMQTDQLPLALAAVPMAVVILGGTNDLAHGLTSIEHIEAMALAARAGGSCVILATLVGQGLTLPWIVGRLGLVAGRVDRPSGHLSSEGAHFVVAMVRFVHRRLGRQPAGRDIERSASGTHHQRDPHALVHDHAVIDTERPGEDRVVVEVLTARQCRLLDVQPLPGVGRSEEHTLNSSH